MSPVPVTLAVQEKPRIRCPNRTPRSQAGSISGVGGKTGATRRKPVVFGPGGCSSVTPAAPGRSRRNLPVRKECRPAPAGELHNALANPTVTGPRYGRVGPDTLPAAYRKYRRRRAAADARRGPRGPDMTDVLAGYQDARLDRTLPSGLTTTCRAERATIRALRSRVPPNTQGSRRGP